MDSIIIKITKCFSDYFPLIKLNIQKEGSNDYYIDIGIRDFYYIIIGNKKIALINEYAEEILNLGRNIPVVEYDLKDIDSFLKSTIEYYNKDLLFTLYYSSIKNKYS